MSAAVDDEKVYVQKGFYLSSVLRKDKEAYLIHYEDSSIAYNLLQVPHPFTEAHAEARIERLEKNKRNPEVIFAIRRSDGFLIGSIATSEDRPDPFRAEFGYWLAKEYRGMNLMPAVIQVFAKYAFTTLQVHRLQATIFLVQ